MRWRGRVLHVRGVDRPHQDAEQGLKCPRAQRFEESAGRLLLYWKTFVCFVFNLQYDHRLRRIRTLIFFFWFSFHRPVWIFMSKRQQQHVDMSPTRHELASNKRRWKMWPSENMVPNMLRPHPLKCSVNFKWLNNVWTLYIYKWDRGEVMRTSWFASGYMSS